jgi:hypothetical protein
MESLEVSRDVPFVFLVRDHVTDRIELSFWVLLG